MNITITGRNFEVTSDVREYSEKRIKKIEKYFNQLIEVLVVMNVQKLDHIVDILVNGDGVQFYAIQKAGDMYSSIDLIIDKMEKQISRYKDRQSDHKAVSHEMVEKIDLENQGVDLHLYQVSNKPKTEIEAFLEMKLDNREFILFKKGVPDVKSDLDYANRNYAVIYRSGDGFKMVEVPFSQIQEARFNPKSFIECDLDIQSESPAKPKVKFKQKDCCTDIEKISLTDALQKLSAGGREFLPFFNLETKSLNVVYKKGRRFEVMVPAF
ncbi:MAG: ribosome-associated translation inhibitor RaiA [Spirochaetes bacterium]|jgi:putative sigma-54 modulation protein|nr:ribosome-associated translation inhibitor RaiA [Spirochaetota bacterium]